MVVAVCPDLGRTDKASCMSNASHDINVKKKKHVR
jgi:hypothetical protein